MRRQIVFLFCTALIAGVAAPCAAELAILDVAGEKVVHDNTNHIIWIHDLTMFSNTSYPQVLAKVEDLNNDSYFGRQDWHVATRSEIDFLWWEYGPDAIEQHFLPSGQKNEQWVWLGRYDELYLGGSSHSLMTTHLVGRRHGPGYGAYADYIARPELSAWVAAVPEPATILFLGLGAIAMRIKR